MATAAESFSAPLDARTMTQGQRLATLLIMLGPDAAGQILGKFKAHEIEKISEDMIHLPPISQEAQIEILQEFSEAVVQSTAGIRGGVAQAQPILEKAVGPARAASILNRNSPVRVNVPELQPILELDPYSLVALLRQEHPQTIALVASHMEPDLVSDLLTLFPEHLRQAVVERLATMAPTPVEVVKRVATVLRHKMGRLHRGAPPSRTGGVKQTASILNNLNKDLARNILLGLGESQPELSQLILYQMFTFEDLLLLDTQSLQRVMREVNTRLLALALKNASERLKGRLLGCMSRRGAEAVQEEIGYLGHVKPRELEAARNEIVDVVRRLDHEGEIDLNEARQQARHAVPA